MLGRILLVTVAAAVLGACATETRVVVAGDDACAAYGFRAGTAEYAQCQSRELAARRQGRVAVATYSSQQVIADAQAACRSYGIVPYSAGFDQCVQREFAARRPV
ncbi:MAG: hypothetical protein JWQ58_191 [Reyranella sp.]|nr:hypothetical protein [Reyranella sp.]